MTHDRLSGRFRPKASIRNKLVAYSFAFLLAVVLILYFVFLGQQRHLLQTQWSESMAAQARLMANNSQAAVAFLDKREAQRLLMSLSINPSIVAARAVLPDGGTLAEYTSRQTPSVAFPVGGQNIQFLDKVLVVREPIMFYGQSTPAGQIELLVSLDQYHANIRETALETLFVLLLALGGLLVAMHYAVKHLTRPLEQLDALANRVSLDANLEQRLGIDREDEIGSLGRSIDRMLESLQNRDRELSTYRESLEEKVEERTCELRDAIAEARQANRAKSDFLARMSHEIRTPMNAIIGLTHMVLDGDLSAEQQEHLEQVLQSSDTLLGLINDILDYSKIEAGRLTLDAAPFQLDRVLQSMSAMFASRARAKGLNFEISATPDIPISLMGDPLRLSQVLINLIGNSLKFTDRGQVGLSVSLRESAAPARVRLEFVVSDTGIGISQDTIGNLFSPFTQADNSITRRFGGTGLGLAISRQLVELMGGTITVDSQPEKGSTFRFDVWLDKLNDAKPHAAAPPDSSTSNVLPDWKGKRVLLVEDVPVNRTVATALLKKTGIEVEAATNGQEALDMLEHKHFDLVLMDIQMPVMDGLTATQALRTQRRFMNLPIIAMTAHASNEDRLLSAAAGMNAHLTKPISPKALYETMAPWLSPEAGAEKQPVSR